MNYTAVSNVRWADAAQTRVLMDVVFPEVSLTAVSFLAAPEDVEPHGRALYAEAVAGTYGAVAPYVAPPPTVPESVTAYQARMVLKAAGYLDAILAYRAALPASDDFAIAWDTGAHVFRNSPLTLALMATLGISPAEADQLFITAAGVT